jgi:hypothetical protein
MSREIKAKWHCGKYSAFFLMPACKKRLKQTLPDTKTSCYAFMALLQRFVLLPGKTWLWGL